MVTKLAVACLLCSCGFILAKIHMVTKHKELLQEYIDGFILAKIHMVTKLLLSFLYYLDGFILAKIHMVTKPQIS